METLDTSATGLVQLIATIFWIIVIYGVLLGIGGNENEGKDLVCKTCGGRNGKHKKGYRCIGHYYYIEKDKVREYE